MSKSEWWKLVMAVSVIAYVVQDHFPFTLGGLFMYAYLQKDSRISEAAPKPRK